MSPSSTKAVSALIFAIAVPGAALAEVKEYQIRRMLYLNTSCGVESLEISKKDGQDRFYATCRNTSHYPEGIEVLCPATEDERECRVVTEKRDFQNLHLLKP